MPVQAWALSLPFLPGEAETRLLAPTPLSRPLFLHRPQAASSPSPPPFPVVPSGWVQFPGKEALRPGPGLEDPGGWVPGGTAEPAL